MAGWHTRAWRRVRLAPGMTINLSKSGPSVSVGPRGSKVTFSRRGVRETVGIPGTGVYATRQLSGGGGRTAARSRPRPAPPPSPLPVSSAGPAVAGQASPPAASVADGAAAGGQVEVYYGFATIVGVIFGIALLLLGLPSSEALLGGAAAIVAGIVYEGLAHHHPGPAKALVQVVVGLVVLATVVGGALLVVLLAVGLGSSTGRRRR